jgi:hypothetical protein
LQRAFDQWAVAAPDIAPCAFLVNRGFAAWFEIKEAAR